jgi:hypothetical protein
MEADRCQEDGLAKGKQKRQITHALNKHGASAEEKETGWEIGRRDCHNNVIAMQPP